jgi:hypothetical protein
MRGSKVLGSILTLCTLLAPFAGGQVHAGPVAQLGSRFFPETGQTVKGRFLEYWEQNGGLMQQGYPVSGEVHERSDIDGKTYIMQYFQRSVFEMHPENQKPNDVLLSLQGVMAYNEKYPTGAPDQVANNDRGSVLFPETGKRVGGSFLAYLTAHGGIRQQGLPISDEFQEVSDVDGKIRTVQYFERAVFEWNPQNKAPYNVLLSLLGSLSYKQKLSPPVQPAIPPVADPNKVQVGPLGSRRYLIWYEGGLSGPRRLPYEFDIRALDLKTNRPVTVTDAPGNQLDAAIEGSLVAWKNDTNTCLPQQGCPQAGIAAKDLATGKSYTIALDGPDYAWHPYSAAVTGRTVAWLERNGDKQHILAKNVDTGATIQVRALDTPSSSILDLQASNGLLAWREVMYGTVPDVPIPYSLMTYDLANGKTTEVIAYQVPPRTLLPEFMLNEGRIALADTHGNFSMIDLATGKRTDLPHLGDSSFLIAMQGDKLLVRQDILDKGSPATSVYGLDLSHPERQAVALLTIPAGAQPPFPEYEATIVGDWLVWNNLNSPKREFSVTKY